jgi:L-seryl-tRNA(Ser) seleniumtransferase
MSGLLESLHITSYINAHDTYTVYGGSRMDKDTVEAMEEFSRVFVDIEELQQKLGDAVAKRTGNEGAYITNGASGALLLASSVCMTCGNQYLFSLLPDTKNCKNEIILMKGQRNAYDKAIEAAGAKIIEIGDADETPAFELEGAITDKTAAVFYFVSMLYERASLPLEDTIRIAHARSVPVVVDAAAQLPPRENLWEFTVNKGADLVLFSGGKTLMGPQDSGLILGRRELIESCRRFGAPAHGICRSSKVSREAMAALYIALEKFLALDSEEEYRRLTEINRHIAAAIEGAGFLRTAIAPAGPVGQYYPRLFIYLNEKNTPRKIAETMRKKHHVYIGQDAATNAVYISPFNLRAEEIDTVCTALRLSLAEGL